MRKGELRFGWKLAVFAVVYIMVTLVAGLVIFLLPLGVDIMTASGAVSLLAALVATAFCVMGIDGKEFATVGLRIHGRAARDLGLGILIASGMIALVALILYLLGMLEITAAVSDFGRGAEILGSGILLYVLVGASEEILLRGYPLQTLIRRFNVAAAIGVTSVAFGMLHIWNPSFGWLPLANITVAGIWLGAAYVVTRSLWLPIGLHIGWNFTMGSVLGFPVSGMVHGSVFVSVEHGSDLITGGTFGPEGGIMVTIVLLAGTALLWFPPVRAFLSGNRTPLKPVHSSEAITEKNDNETTRI